MLRNFILVLVIIIISISCEDLPYSYGKVTEDKASLIDFIFEPSEAAPGDTVDLYAIFAGKKLDVDDVNWTISWKVIKSQFGIDTAIEIKPFEGEISPCYFSPKTSCIHLSFKIPEDCIANSSIIEEDWSVLFDGDTLFTKNILSTSVKKDIISIFDSISRYPAEAEKIFYGNEMSFYLSEYLPIFAQLFSVKVRIFAEIKGTTNFIKSDYFVNYNRIFNNFPSFGIKSNTNPKNIVDAIVLYRIKDDENTTDIDTIRKKSDISINLLNKDSIEILIDKGYAYYLNIIMNNLRDSAYIFNTSSDTLKIEKDEEVYYCSWYYKMEEKETKGLSENQLLSIVQIDNNLARLLPPTTNNVKNFTIWLKIKDDVPQTINRSQGSYVWEISGKFTYTQDYFNQFTK